MKILLYILPLIISTHQYTKCYEWVGNSFYSLKGLENEFENIQLFEDKTTIHWNSCDQYVNSFQEYETYFVYNESEEKSLVLTGKNIEKIQQIDRNNPYKGIKIDYEKSETSISFQLVIECQKNAHIVTYFDPPTKTEDNTYTMKIKAKSGCPEIELSAIWNFFHDYKYIFTPILLAIGILNCFFGQKYFKETIFTIGFLASFFLSILLLSNFIQSTTPNYVNWVITIFSACIGVAVGGYLYKFEKYSFFFMGAVGFFLLATLLYQSLLHDYFHQEFYVYLYFAVFIVGGGILGIQIRTYIMILITSMLGSYLLVRSFSVMVYGGKYFPNEFTLYKMIQSGAYEFPYEFYFFLVAIVILWAAGLHIQTKEQKSQEDDQDYKQISDTNTRDIQLKTMN